MKKTPSTSQVKSKSSSIKPRSFFLIFETILSPTLCIYLNLSWRWPISYRNQFIDLLRKSMNWFLYDIGLRHERVNLPNMERHFGQKLRFIFMMNDQDFHDKRSTFPWWMAEIFMMTDPELLIALTKIPAFMGPTVSRWEFFFLLLVYLNEMMTLGESRVLSLWLWY